MDVIKRIDELMKERQWSDYKLAIESGLSSSTIANIHRCQSPEKLTTQSPAETTNPSSLEIANAPAWLIDYRQLFSWIADFYRISF